MKNMLTAALLIAACAVLATSVQAQPAGGGGARGGGMGMMGGGVNFKQLTDQLTLTDEQKTKVADVLTAAQAEATALREKNQDKLTELMTQMRAARDANDQAKVTSLQADLAKLMDTAGREQATRAKLKPILTDEQNKKLDELIVAARRAAIQPAVVADTVAKNAASLGLKDDQVAKIMDLAKATQGAAQKVMAGDGDRATKMADVRKLNDKFTTDLKGVLTADQQAALDKLLLPPATAAPAAGAMDPVARIKAGLKDITLSADQQTKVDALLKTADESLKAPDADRRTISRQLRTDVLAVLTDDQKAKFNAAMPAGGRGRGGAGRATTQPSN